MKVGIYTLGCKVNNYESEYMTSLLENHGFEICSFDDTCDVYIINTCTVTNTSDVKSRKIIRQARKKNKNAVVVACGCYIQANKNNIIDEVDIAIGNKDKSRIVELINKYLLDKNKINNVVDDFDISFEDMFINNYKSKTRAFVKIQDGCENFCSYCIIPYVRGKCRSKDKETVLREINELVRNGFKEVVLTGIHTGNYGRDINSSFSELLKEIVKIDGLERLRISSIEVNELTDDVLNIIKNNPKIVNHLHIPIQSASDKVLKTMNRKYDLKTYIKKINDLRNIRKDINITTDIIVGHPNEEDEDFEESLNVIKEIGFSKIHVFPFSLRSGTKAEGMKQVPDMTKKIRAHKLIKLSRELEIEYYRKFIGKTLPVLIEKSNDNYSIGHTENYILVKVYNKKYSSGDIIEVTLKEIEYPFVVGES